MRGKCGLVNSANPCRCARKTRGAIRAGIVDPKSLKFVPSHVTRIEQDAKERSPELRHRVGAGYAYLFRDPDLREPPDLVSRLRAIVSDERFRAPWIWTPNRHNRHDAPSREPWRSTARTLCRWLPLWTGNRPDELIQTMQTMSST
jgi:hypothetical protein